MSVPILIEHWSLHQVHVRYAHLETLINNMPLYYFNQKKINNMPRLIFRRKMPLFISKYKNVTSKLDEFLFGYNKKERGI